ncbi:hypothetical protein GCM10010350_64450 [Streptomyces galilaeus]|nr:hypothetical protein GCM10010350_64450 [Streptomyces galilaeus]
MGHSELLPRLMEGGGPASAPSAVLSGPLAWTAYLHPSEVRYRTRLVGVPRVRQHGRRLLAVPARYCGLTARPVRPASPRTYAPPDGPDKRMVGGERDAAGCSA